MAHQKPTIIFDSNIWIGYFLENDSLHKKCVSIFKKYNTHPILIPEYVLMEVATIIKQRVGFEVMRTIVEHLTMTEGLVVKSLSDNFAETLELFLLLNEKHLSFVDVSLLVLEKEFEVITFDKKLAKVIKG